MLNNSITGPLQATASCSGSCWVFAQHEYASSSARMVHSVETAGISTGPAVALGFSLGRHIGDRDQNARFRNCLISTQKMNWMLDNYAGCA